jgi:predicted peptidase
MVLNSTRKHSLNYLLYLPLNFTNDKKWPLILFLHGAGERGNNLELLKRYGIQTKLLKEPDFPCVVISPQCPENSIWEMQFDLLTELLDETVNKYPIDEKRIYLTGISMGGYGTWNYAILNPDKFAAIVPVSGGAMMLKHAVRLKDTPIWVFHGREDISIPIEESQRVVDVLKACNGNVRFSNIPDAGHEVCTTAYKNDEIFDWLLKQHKI